MLADLAETILPATDTPGAKAAGVGAFIAHLISHCTAPVPQQAFRQGLKNAEACDRRGLHDLVVLREPLAHVHGLHRPRRRFRRTRTPGQATMNQVVDMTKCPDLIGLTRRSFLTTLGAGAACLSARTWPAEPAVGRVKRLGFMAGLVASELNTDWRGTLQKAAELGFSEIELSNFYGPSAAEFMQFCRSVGIKPIGGGGIPMAATGNALNVKVDELNALGAHYAVVYWPWLTGEPFSLADCQRSAELLNAMGKTCREQGLTLCWHNHDKEFILMETGLPYDYLMTHTDPALVKAEMDVYWVAKGGADPLTVLQRYASRYVVLHVKDMAPGPTQDFACAGSGILYVKAILSEAHRQGVQHYMLERDNVNVVDGLACLATGGQFMRRLRF